MLHKLIYLIRVALNNIAQNLVANLVSTGTIALALLILSGFTLIYINLQHLIESSSRELSVSVYLDDGLKPKELGKIKRRLSGMPEVAGVRHITKAQAMVYLKKRLGDQGGFLEGLDENPLPASFELELKPAFRSKERVQALISRLEGLKGVAEIDYGWEWADKLSVFIDFFRLAGLVIGGLLFLVTIFIVANTIKLMLYSRQDELYIMRLMGATEGFVRIPFFIEGFLQGLCGGILALMALFIMFQLLLSQVQLPLGLSLINLSFLSSTLVWGLVGLGTCLGLLGTFVSLGRFMPS